MVKLLASIDTSLTKHIHELIQLYHLEREPRGSHLCGNAPTPILCRA
jgi:hypothetical protein